MHAGGGGPTLGHDVWIDIGLREHPRSEARHDVRTVQRPVLRSQGGRHRPVRKPIAGDITSQILLWDAGTEVNEEPGLGPNQAPLQPAPNTGPVEHGVRGEGWLSLPQRRRGASSHHHARPDGDALNRPSHAGARRRLSLSF
jgi:hypothetical protein